MEKRYKITDVHERDSYYENRADLVGQIVVPTSERGKPLQKADTSPRKREGWLCGGCIPETGVYAGKFIYFFAIKAKVVRKPAVKKAKKENKEVQR